MKKLTCSIFLMFVFILLSVVKVNAAVSPYFKDITFPATYKIYNLTSSNTRSEISTTKSCISNETDYFDICFVTWDATFATYGYGINILTDNTFLTGNNYGVTYYFGSNNWVWYSNWYSSYTPQSYISGGWWENSSNNILSEQRNDCIDLGSTYNEHVYGYRYLCSYNQVFEATNTGYYLWTVFNRSTTGSATEQDFSFLGYSISNQGASGLTVEEIKTSLASDFEELESSISSMKDTQEETNNKIEQQTQQQQQNHQETMDTITSTDVDSPDDSFSEFESYLPENGVITELITLPISLFQRVLSSINGTCSDYNLGNLFGTDLTLPCINISNYIGTPLWNVIDVLFSGFFVLVIGKKMIKAFNNFSSLEEGDVLD